MTETLSLAKQEIITMLAGYASKGILEKKNVELLTKLINNADTTEEVLAISALGTTYKRTGLHFDKRLEKTDTEVKYFTKNSDLSFINNELSLNHKLIIGDNYYALLNLLIEYKGVIDVIYIDPPYAKDSMGHYAKTNYDNSITRDNLLSMLYPRLVLAKMLLAEDGLFFMSIDDRNYAYVKCLLDDILGESYFVNSFVWKRNSSGKTEKDKFTVNTEYVLLYAKSNKYILNPAYKPLEDSSIKLYNKNDNDGRGYYQTVSLQKPANPGPKTSYDYIDNTGKVWPCPPKGWRLEYDKIKALENDGRLSFEGKRPREKDYWNERPSEGKRIDTLWADLPENSKGSSELESILGKNDFDNPKPTKLIQRCLEIGNKNAIVLDFFAGSGTTGQAVLEQNRIDGGCREFILCTNNNIEDGTIAYNITSKRLKRIMTGCCYDNTKTFKWLEKHKPYGDNLDVLEIKSTSSFEKNPGKTIFDLLDESLYGKHFNNIRDKIDWICQNFDRTQRVIESDQEWANRTINK